MKRVFENDHDLKFLNDNLVSTLQDAHKNIANVLEFCGDIDMKKRLLSIEQEVDSVKKSLLKINQLIVLNHFSGNRWKRIEISSPLLKSIETHKAQASKKEITLNFENKTTKAISYGDELIFEEFLFNNLISNAIKFAPNGSKVLISLAQEDEYNIVTIRDFGVGIAPSQLEILTSVKDRSFTPDTEGMIGSGMSFPIVAQIMNKLNGEVKVRSSMKDLTNFERGTETKLIFNRF